MARHHISLDGSRALRPLHIILVVQLVLGALLAALVVQPTPVAARSGLYGVNLEYVQDWRPGLMFTDLIKQSRGWDLPAFNGRAPVDANGWPTADALTICVVGDASWDLGGTYKLSFNGQATISSAADPFTVTNQTYTSTTNTTTADLVMPSSTASIWLKLTNTRRTASSATNTGVTNVKLIRPGYPADGSQTFSNEFLTGVSKFAVFRTMNAVNTNGNVPAYPDRTEWAERKTPSYATQTADNVAGSVEKTGVAWEYLIQLANQTATDIWVNVPMSASDDYVTRLATLLRDGNGFTTPLNPDRKIYVELSNEIWNGIFPSRNYQIAWANALGMDQFDLPAKRTVEISNLFRTVFGASAINSRVRVIYAAQIANSGTYHMDYINRTYGPPRNFIYAVSGAPYFNAGSLNTTGSVDQLLSAMRSNIDNESRSAKQFLINLANTWGVKAICYEGGPDNGGGSTANLANRIAANRDPRIKDLMVRDVTTQWWDLGGELFMHYKMFSRYDQHGMWGLSERHNDLTSIKWQAVDQIMNSSPNPGPTSTPTTGPTSTPPPAGNGMGLRGEYFNNLALTAPATLTRTDAQVNFEWSGSPGTGIGVDNFSVRWTGRVQAPVTGSYTFATTSDDGIRLWVNGQQLINNWTDHGPTTDTAAPISLTAGQQYPVTLEFYERGGGATARLLWSYPGQAQVTIPQSQLYPASGTTPPPTPVPTTAPGGTVTLTPTDDRDTQSDSAAGTNPEIAASQWNHLFARFNLGSVSGPVKSARFRLHKNVASSTLGMTVHQASSDSWSQSGATPALGSAILSLTAPNATGYVEVDVTSVVAAQVAGDKLVTFGVTTNSGSWTGFSSKEGANAPQLVVMYGP